MLESSIQARTAGMSAQSAQSEQPRQSESGSADTAPGNAAVARIASVLAFDFGERFIGVAIGDRMLRIAHPLTTLEARSAAERFAKIGALIDEWQPSLLVVGMPSTADGAPHPLAPRITRFSRQLAGRFRLHVQLIDEQCTSVEAERDLRGAGVRGADLKQQVHPQAARLILESYFNDVAA